MIVNPTFGWRFEENDSGFNIVLDLHGETGESTEIVLPDGFRVESLAFGLTKVAAMTYYAEEHGIEAACFKYDLTPNTPENDSSDLLWSELEEGGSTPT